MCFSAAASFTASAILGTAGVASISINKKKEAIIFSSIPLFFSIQQLSEGFQWLALQNGAPSPFFGYAFVFFAYLFWPIYIPLAVSLIESDVHRRRLQQTLMILGVLISLSLFFLITNTPGEVSIQCQRLVYKSVASLNYPFLTVYVLATSGAAMISTQPWLKFFGIATFLSLILTLTIAQAAFVSVWCFFSAILSVFILQAVRVYNRNKKRSG